MCVSTSGFEAVQCPAKTKMASGLVKLTGSGLWEDVASMVNLHIAEICTQHGTTKIK